MSIFALSIRDFFTPKMLKYAIMPFIATLIIMYVLFFVLAGAGLDSMNTSLDIHTTQTTIQNGIPMSENFSAHVENSSIIQFLMKYSVTSWLAGFLVYAIGGFFVLYASVFIAVIIIGFMTPFVLKELQIRHYRDIEMIGYSNIFESLFLVIKWAFVMVLMFFLLIPFYFIPLLNIIAFNLPLYYFFHKMMIFDISSNLTTKEENNQIKYFNKGSLRAKTLLLYIVSLIPFAIFFGAIFYVIYLGNTYFIAVKKLRDDK
ncbi:MAG: EI24 domain-containing protein [Epsilonproteobacteria bacterium]|nr:EI24 domain-containing protein [Campylobacterota bacterium]